jgi:hypothetical protein
VVNPRIYRAALGLIVVAVILFGFSLQPSPSPAGTKLTPGLFFSGAYQSCCSRAPNSLASLYPDRLPGSNAVDGSAPDSLASKLYQQLQTISGFHVSESAATTETARGQQTLDTVTATRTGLEAGTIVVVSGRDAEVSPAASQLSGTAVLIGLARALGGATLQRTVMLVSISGTVGDAGAVQLAKSLAGQDVDAVITLGDLAGADLRGPVVQSWSLGDSETPLLLRATLASFVHSQTGIGVGAPGAVSQVMHLAFPLTVGQQAPFLDDGIPAVGLSTLADHQAPASEPGSAARVDELGGAVLRTVEALEAGRTVPAPSAFLMIGRQFVPLWAIRLLLLTLILPVAITTIDGLARARRRGHPLLTWLVWVLIGAVPFLIAAAAVVIAGKAGALSATPPGPVIGGVRIGGSGLTVLAVVAVLAAGGSYLLRPWLLRLAAGLGAHAGDPSSPRIEGAVVALMLTVSALALVLWVFNPFAALLLVPALHCWLWIADPNVRERKRLVLSLALLGIVPALAVAVYYLHTLDISPLRLVWTGVLMVAGGGMSYLTTLFWALALGTFASAMVLAIRVLKTPAAADAPVTVRGPSTYAGPGSLGGTESALRR